MNKDVLEDVYKDFFGEYNEKKNEEVEIESNTIDLSNLLVDDESLKLLNNMYQYMIDYKDGKKVFLPFSIIIESDNKETITRVVDNFISMITETKYISSNSVLKMSFYNLDNLDVFKDKDIIVLSDITGINLKDNNYIKKLFFTLKELLENKKIIVISGTKEEIDLFFQNDSSLMNKYFPFRINGINPSVNDIYNEVLSIVEESANLDDDFKISILDYITNTFEKTDMDYPSYRDNLCREILFNHKLPVVESTKTIDEVFKELNELVGLKKVKKTLYELVDYMNFIKKNKDFNLKSVNLHMVFLGNPGTGKTTVARLVSNILYELGFIKQNKLLEVTVKDLVAEYVGQTAPKVMNVVEKAMGGVLFIDEAYALASTNDSSYNDEAIATLIKAMEDNRDNLVVIFAGYTKEMQDFLDSNSGIVSRIGYTFEFDDYTEDELVEIFKGMVTKAGFVANDDAILKLRDIIREYKDTKNFGNARFVRNVYEKTIIKHASNTKNKKRRDILKTITKDDISVDNLSK